MLGSEKCNEFHVICGSHLKDDEKSEDYSYSLLSSIILHMEAGRTILLQGVEKIWSALYDMLNQHYTVVGGRRNCRIALGPHSNPMCFVHKNFRCIITVQQSEIATLDPPFLNRFEKQVLTYETLLDDKQISITSQLLQWVEDISILRDPKTKKLLPFTTEDMFATFNKNTIPALILRSSLTHDNNSVMEDCKRRLILSAFPDSIVRAKYSSFARSKPLEMQYYYDYYFKYVTGRGFKDLIKKILNNPDELGVKVTINTWSSIHFNLNSVFEDSNVFQVERLGAMTAESQLQNCIHQFLSSDGSKQRFLLLQVDYEKDYEHLTLVKFVIDRMLIEHRRTLEYSKSPRLSKNIIILIHGQQFKEKRRENICSFFGGWKQFAFDSLEPYESLLKSFLGKSVTEVVESGVYDFLHQAPRIFTWCFMQLQYPEHMKSAENIKSIVNEFSENRELLQCFQNRIISELRGECNRDWQAMVACDKGRLAISRTLYKALFLYVEEKVRDVALKLVFLLEKRGALRSLVSAEIDQEMHLENETYSTAGNIASEMHESQFSVSKSSWMKVLMNVIPNKQLLNVEDAGLGYGGDVPYSISDCSLRRIPLGDLYAQTLDDRFRKFYLDEIKLSSTMDTVDIRRKVLRENLLQNFNMDSSELRLVSDYVEHNISDYAHDLVRLKFTDGHGNEIEKYFQLCEAVLLGNTLFNSEEIAPLDFHICLWENEEEMRDQLKMLISVLDEGEAVKYLFEKRNALNDRISLKHSRVYSSNDKFIDEIAGKCCMKLLRIFKLHTCIDIKMEDENEGGYFDEDGNDKDDDDVKYMLDMDNETQTSVNAVSYENFDVDSWVEKSSSLFSALESEAYAWQIFPAFCAFYEFNCIVKPRQSGVDMVKKIASWILNHGICPPMIKFHEKMVSIWNSYAISHEVDDGSCESNAWNRFLRSFSLKCLEYGTSSEHEIYIARSLVKNEKISCECVPLVLHLLRRTRLITHVPTSFQENSSVESRLNMYSGFIHVLNSDDCNGNSIEKALFDGANGTQWPVLLIDIIQSEFCPRVTNRLLKGEKDELWPTSNFEDCIKTAVACFTHMINEKAVNESVKWTLKRICAFSLLYSITLSLAKRIVEENSPIIHPKLIDLLVPAMLGSNPECKLLHSLLFKHLRKTLQLSMFDIVFKHKKFSEKRASKRLAMLLDYQLLVNVDDARVDKLGYNPFFLASNDYQQANHALTCLIKRQDNEMSDFLHQCTSNLNCRLALLSAVLSKFYPLKFIRKLNPKEKKAIDKLSGQKDEEWNFKISPPFQYIIESFSLNEFPKTNILHIGNGDTKDLHLKAVIAHFIINLQGYSHSSPLVGYANLNLSHIGQAFFLSGPSDERGSIFKAVMHKSGNTRIYKCNNCGELYGIGNCGNPVEISHCTNCKSLIGGSNHKATSNTSAIHDQQSVLAANTLKGYIKDHSASRGIHCVRGLTPASYRVLRFFAHSALLWGCTVPYTSDEQVQQLKGLPLTKVEAAEELSMMLKQDANLLEELLSQNWETVCMMLHEFCDVLGRIQIDGPLSQPESRDQWESTFQQFSTPIFNDITAVAKRFKEVHSEDNSMAPLERIVDENEEDNSIHPIFNRMFRFKVAPSWNHFRTFVLDQQDISNDKNHHDPSLPFLHLIFAEHDNLVLIKCLKPILRWILLLRSVLRNRIFRYQASLCSIDKIIRDYGENKEEWRIIFNEFACAWNTVSPFVHRFECTEFKKELPKMHSHSSVSLCLLDEKDDAAYLYGILQYLIDLQNRFLDAFMNLNLGISDSELIHFQNEIKTKAAVEVQKINMNYIIVYDHEDTEGIIRNHGLSEIEYGSGDFIHYDILTIQSQLARNLVHRKRKLALEVKKFEFAGESFARNTTLLFQVNQILPRREISRNVMDELRMDLDSTNSGVSNLMMTLQLCFGYLVRTGTDPNELLTVYCARWLDENIAVELNRRCFHLLSVSHSISLYEGLEELLFENIPDLVHENYKCDLPFSVKCNLEESIRTTFIRKDGYDKEGSEMKIIGELDIQTLRNSLSRFILRYLCKEAFNPDHPLEIYLGNESLSCFPNCNETPDLSDLFPVEVMLKHSFAVYWLFSQV